MSSSKKILVVSQDLMALQTRKLMLGAYFEVTPAGRAAEAKSLLASHGFDLVILCYTISDEDARHIIAAAHAAAPRVKILLLTASGYAPKPFALPQLRCEEGPFVLVRKAAEMLGYGFISKGRMVPAAPPLIAA